MAEITTIARPYARAAFEQAHAAGELAPWSGVLQAAALIAAVPAARSLLASPKLSYADKAELVLGVCAEVCGDGIPPAARNFILLLAENNRLAVLPQIATIFEKLRADADQLVQAQVVSAFPVSEAQRDQIAQGLQQRLKRNVVLDCTVDASLIGGAVIRAGDLVIDGSVRGQLDKLAVALSH